MPAPSQDGRPRFKGKGQVHSVEVRPLIDPDDQVVRHALCSGVEYVRSVRRRVRLRTRWYVQLVCAERPYRQPRHGMGRGVVGLDVGPSTLAAVSAREATLAAFCPEVEAPAQEVRRLQRHIDR